MKIKRYFTQEGIHPFDTINWITRDVKITKPDGTIVFNQDSVECPDFWSANAVQIAASKYFYGKLDTLQRETSIRQLVHRVANTISQKVLDMNYFDEISSKIFYDELCHLMIHQIGLFNSPVLFNCGTTEGVVGQGSACFINEIEDTIDSITDLVKTEAKLFKYGSGSGVNISPLRSKHEHVTGGGKASGPVSFMKLHDSNAGTVMSGGRTRRAAKLVCMNDTHPDILDFITCKSNEEKKSKILMDGGYQYEDASNSVSFQNANHSVRVTDAFMNAVIEDKEWTTYNITDKKPHKTYKAKDILKKIATECYNTGDPGLQYHDIINKWNTCKSQDIVASNPCSEYHFLSSTSCNLASLNLMRFYKNSKFQCEDFMAAIKIFIIAQDVIVHSATYPTKKIETETKKYAALGLGYANVGTLLSYMEAPYGDNESCEIVSAITSLLSSTAYRVSAELAKELGPFKGYNENKDSMLDVIKLHQKYDSQLTKYEDILNHSHKQWNKALKLGKEFGFRNAQAVVAAPTGTIGMTMDCSTLGIEPEISLIKYKTLSGGGVMSIINSNITNLLAHLGYTAETISDIETHIAKKQEFPIHKILDNHKDLFLCALETPGVTGTISYQKHLNILEAAQPFLSGAASKTVNLPKDTSPEEIYNIYINAWKKGIKCVALYRDGAKSWQPITTNKEKTQTREEKKPQKEENKHNKESIKPQRMKLPTTRKSLTHKFSIGGHEGYITVGLYDNGSPGELFIVMNKEGSTISGLMDGFATSISMALQYGVPLSKLCEKFEHMRFEPSGFTGNKDVPMAKSILDYIFRWLHKNFIPEEKPMTNGSISHEYDTIVDAIMPNSSDASPCTICGSMMVRQGTCYYCQECGSTSGCS